MLSRLRRRRAHQPRLSVVVPVYNVEPYLAECLDSILAQTYDDLEVMLVDDGSTDGSVRIAEDYVRRHEHLGMIHQENAGLSAARNAGIRQVGGELLAFADSDDLVPDDAYERMVSTLDESGSDLVVGSVLQGQPTQASVPGWLRPLHQQRRIGISIDDYPALIHNVFAWSKVFRRAFWDRVGLSFPDGLRYEDQVTMTHAYLCAEKIDVLVRPVYLWRVRTDGSSITQRRHELADLEDRIATKLMTTDIVHRLGTADVDEQWRFQGLPGDLPQYFRQLPESSDDYWRRLHAGMGEMVDIDDIPHWLLPAPQRLIGWLVLRGRREDAVEVVGQVERGVALDVRGDHVVAVLPYADDNSRDVPHELYRLGDHEMIFDARLVALDSDETTLTVDGWALIRGVPPGVLPTTVTAVWRRDDGVDVACQVTPWSSSAITSWVDRDPQDYDRSGFTATVELAALATAPARGGHQAAVHGGDWHLVVRRQVAAISREGFLRSRATVDGEPVSMPAAIAGGLPVKLTWHPGGAGLRLTELSSVRGHAPPA